MSKNKQSYPSIEQVEKWLTHYHNNEIRNLASLSGGFWSSAFSYSVGTQDYVFRLSDMTEGFVIDKAAMRFNNPNLPIPKVIEIGKALGFNYAISERHYGQFIETTTADEGSNVGIALETLLAELRAIPTSENDLVIWYAPEESKILTWHSWLLNGLTDNPNFLVSGWRSKLAEKPDIDNLFLICKSRILELLPVCPERRDLIHGDLLHQNVLVSEDASQVTAIFSWKCSALGDFLYDVAWCTFWGDWHPGIAASDIWNRTMSANDLTEDDLMNAHLRHHCYELQIGASHLGWNVWVGNEKELEALAQVLNRKLAEGPIPSAA